MSAQNTRDAMEVRTTSPMKSVCADCSRNDSKDLGDFEPDGTEADHVPSDPDPQCEEARLLVSASITWSTVKLAAFWRGGYSLNVARNWPT